MNTFSPSSLERLNTCHPDLQMICSEVIKTMDFTVFDGHRSLEKQQEYYKSTPPRTTLDGIVKISKHQHLPSMAVDIVPYPIDFKEVSKSKARFYLLAGIMLQASEELLRRGVTTHKLRWGGDWDGDKEFYDQSFDDLPHFELVGV